MLLEEIGGDKTEIRQRFLRVARMIFMRSFESVASR
jgi:hypothetical protein